MNIIKIVFYFYINYLSIFVKYYLWFNFAKNIINIFNEKMNANKNIVFLIEFYVEYIFFYN